MAARRVPKAARSAASNPVEPASQFWPGAALLLGFVLVVGLCQIRSLDLWWHLATGRWIAEGHSIPRTDPFSHSAAGQPWIAHEWLFGLLAYGVLQAGGTTGLVVARALAVAGLFGLSAWVARLRGAAAAPTLVVLAAAYPICRFRFTERPDLVSAGLAVGFLAAAEIGRRRRAALIAWPLLELAWANLHGGTALLGWGIAGALAFDRIVEERTPGRPWRALLSDGGLRPVVAAALAVPLASLANPFGARILVYGLIRARSPIDNREFQSVLEITRQGSDPSLLVFALFAGLLLALFVLAPAHVRPSEWLLGAALAAASLAAFRFRLYFVFVAAPWLALFLSRRLPATGRTWRALLGGAALALAGWSVALERGSEFYRFGPGIHAGLFPAGAAAFVRAAPLTGTMFNSYGFGGFLAWELGPERKVFVDGREDVYLAAGVLDEYVHAFDSRERWRRLVERHGIGYAIVQYPEQAPARLDASPEVVAFGRDDWALVYYDDVAAVYARRRGLDADWLRRHEITAIQPLQRSSYLDALLRDPERSRRFFEEVAAHRARVPDSFRDAFLLGMAAAKRGSEHLAEAVAEFERAAALNPDFAPAFVNLGSLYLHLGRRADARRAFERALDLGPDPFAREQLRLLR